MRSPYMQDILIYSGIAINIIGALYLMAYGMKYAYAFYTARKQRALTDSMKPTWAKKRTIGFSLMIGGSLIALLGCII